MIMQYFLCEKEAKKTFNEDSRTKRKSEFFMFNERNFCNNKEEQKTFYKVTKC